MTIHTIFGYNICKTSDDLTFPDLWKWQTEWWASLSIIGIKVSAVGLELLLVLQMPVMAGIYEMTWHEGVVRVLGDSHVYCSFHWVKHDHTILKTAIKKSKWHAKLKSYNMGIWIHAIMCFLCVKSQNENIKLTSSDDGLKFIPINLQVASD